MAITLNPWDVTRAAAETSLTRVIGKVGDTEATAEATETLSRILRSLNNRREWHWLQASATANVTTDGLLTLPSRFKKFYSVIIAGQGPLAFLSQRRYDQINPTGSSLGGVVAYIPFNLADTAAVQLRDAPAATTVVTVNYLRMLTVPAGATALIDVPENVGDYIIAEGRARMLATYGGASELLSYWDQKAKELRAELIREDVNQPDRDLYLVSAPELFVGEADYDWGNHAG